MTQITVITPSRQPGTLADISQVLGDAGVNIHEISAHESSTEGLFVIHAAPYDLALRALSDAGYRAVSEDVLVLRIKDEPGGLARLARQCGNAGVNIQSLHILQRDDGNVLVAANTDNNTDAAEALGEYLVQ